ncbi:DUF1707 SHOCT-like domain-containing protein [Pseudonocardia pini]|uniref:DUF1707 SHOCT-like domain-containing protein n=1 Tax=Pseudonocardia pini TaxID=2758030 RepID=UPI0015F081CF|nr:DUF1707 domain-containing protein [Pseudonocardia pini]
MGDEIAPQDLRVSHAERERVSTLLSQHFAEGRLTVDEYGQRAEAASVAVTRADLNRLLLDLPGADAVRVREVLELTTTAGDLRKQGEWTVPARIVLRSRMGNGHLDFRTARFTTPVVTVDVDIMVGNLDIRLPKGATVDVDEARTSVGQLVDKVGPSLERGNPHVIVRGVTRLGNIRVRT